MAASGSPIALRLRPWLVLAAALPLVGPCHKAAEAPRAASPPAPVFVAKAEGRTVPVELRNIGSVQPYRTVAIKARVGGQITSVKFREGQDVKQGELLLTIDPRPMDAALAEAEARLLGDEAALAKERASLAKAEVDVKRYRSLVASNTVSDEIYQDVLLRRQTQVATVAASHAAIEAAKASIRAAQVLRDYADIASPIDGRTGDMLVDEGNVVKADDTAPLVVINQITPIYVQFAVAENYLPEIRRRMSEGPLVVRALPPGEDNPLTGTLTFLDNAVDRTTGTIQLKGTFENTDRRLWPGQFVDVTLVLRSIADAVCVPSEALQTSQQGEYVYVVTRENKAELRPVTLEMHLGNDVVIRSGVAAGETVVVDGHLRLKPGATVDVKQRREDAAAKR